jgi:hypothetical protein
MELTSAVERSELPNLYSPNGPSLGDQTPKLGLYITPRRVSVTFREDGAHEIVSEWVRPVP